jgi:glycine oxidase
VGENSDCVIIGGGVVGLSVARQLARDSFRTVLLEKGTCGREASWAGAGLLAPAPPTRKDVLAQLNDLSLVMFPDFCREVHEESGIDPEYQRCGEVQLAFNDADLKRAASFADASCDRLAAFGNDLFQVLSPKEAREVEPMVSPDAVGGLVCRAAGQVRNSRLMAALRESCVRNGVDIREGVIVEQILDSGNKVHGVRTADGDIRAESVVLAAGAWSSQIDSRIASLAPVIPVRGQMILLAGEPGKLGMVISKDQTYLVPRLDGHVLLGATLEPDAGFSRRTTSAGISHLIQSGLSLCPSLAEWPVESTWAGLRPGTPDERPYLGCAESLDGLILATGHFRTGLTLAPVTAQFVSSLLRGESFPLDLTSCRPGRAIVPVEMTGG